jgi:glucokinase
MALKMKENDSQVKRAMTQTADGLLLAGDIGGTKTLLGLYDAARPRPREQTTRAFATLDYPHLSIIVDAFLRETGVPATSIAAACFGVAGPVMHQTAQLTNVPWRIAASDVAATFGIPHVSLLNDLEAMASSVPVLADDEMCVLQDGKGGTGNIAVIAAGTGLGEAFLHRVNGAFIPTATEGGHADFPARTEEEITLLRFLVRRYGRAEVEQVVSGRGLVNIHQVTHRGACAAGVDLTHPDAPAAISQAALARACDGCTAALDLFVGAYGAEAGNLALRTLATGGVFVGGGIAPKILPALTTGAFLRAFFEKSPFEPMLQAIKVAVILNSHTGLLGAAVHAATDR